MIVGRTYLERGLGVRVLARWGPGGGPRNVLVERYAGERIVRPFRGLRRPRMFVASRLPDAFALERYYADADHDAWRETAELSLRETVIELGVRLP